MFCLRNQGIDNPKFIRLLNHNFQIAKLLLNRPYCFTLSRDFFLDLKLINNDVILTVKIHQVIRSLYTSAIFYHYEINLYEVILFFVISNRVYNYKCHKIELYFFLCTSNLKKTTAWSLYQNTP